MSLITNRNDASGQDMFSKAGKSTTEKYIIFQKKDEILYDKRKTINIKEFNKKNRKKKNQEMLQEDDQDNDLEEINRLKEEQFNKQLQNQAENNKQKVQPFGKIQGREDVIRIKEVKNPPPPVGYYNPKYNQLDKNLHHTQNYSQYSKTRFKTQKGCYQPSITLQEEIERPAITQRLKDKIVGPLTLDFQKGRDNIFINKKGNPHEKRFEECKVNQTCSNVRRVQGFDIKSSQGRDDGLLYANKEHAPDYHADYEINKKVIAVSVPQFKKHLSRKPFHKESLTQNENFFNYDHYAKEKNQKSQLYTRIQTPTMSKQLPRHHVHKSKKEEEPFNMPTFMQKNVSSRMAIANLNQKMLEQNFYPTGRFQTIHTGFPRQKSKREKVDHDLIEESIIDEPEK